MALPLKVQVYSGSDLLREERFDRDIIKIGRLASAHLKLDDPRVARIHAVIEATSDGQGFSIIDMGSTDGTFVNGARVSKERLNDGDEIAVGECRLRVVLNDAANGEAVSGLPVPEPAVSEPPAPVSVPAPAWSAAPAPIAEASIPSAPAPVASAPVSIASAPAPAVSAPAPVRSSITPAAEISFPPSEPAGTAPLRYGSFLESEAPPAVPAELTHGSRPPRPAPMHSGLWMPTPGMQFGAWGSAPNNLASQSVPESDRMLEIKTIWGDSVLDAVNVYDEPRVTMGDEARVQGWGPFAKYLGCDIDVPASNLPVRAWPIAESMGGDGCNYAINVHESMGGRCERADGSLIPISDLVRRGERSSMANTWKVPLLAEDTLYLRHGDVRLQIRYIRRTRFVPPPWYTTTNFTYLNIFILAFFFHVLTIATFLAKPQVTEDLTERLFKNPNRFHQFAFIKKEEERRQNDLLAKLKGGPAGAKAAGKEGKAGKKDMPDTSKRMAVQGDPNDKEIAKSTLNKLFGSTDGAGRRSILFGTGGLGGELTAAMGGVTGAEIGDSGGLGGLGTRGAGPGGGGLSMNSVGLGALGTAGIGGGGDGNYGANAGNLGKKADREIDISAGTPLIMGSLDKEIIRRVIKEHIAQIRYCYEKELIRSPGLFGKVNMEFVINAEGGVREAKVKDSTMNNEEVERCMGSKIRTWTFPKPKGGGVVIVRYPFVFKRTG